MEAKIGLKTTAKENLIQILNTVVADEHLLYVKLRNYHWNVKGRQFAALHEMFEQQYDIVKAQTDEIAERVQMLGGRTNGRMTDFLNTTRLSEAPEQHLKAAEMITDLLETNEHMVQNLRADISAAGEEYGDEGTADLLTETIQLHEQMAWMLRAYLEE